MCFAHSQTKPKTSGAQGRHLKRKPQTKNAHNNKQIQTNICCFALLFVVCSLIMLFVVLFLLFCVLSVVVRGLCDLCLFCGCCCCVKCVVVVLCCLSRFLGCLIVCVSVVVFLFCSIPNKPNNQVVPRDAA